MVFMTQHPLESSAAACKPTARKDDSGDSRTNVLKERGPKCPRAAVVKTFLSANVVGSSASICCREKAGELGRMRIGTVKFLGHGLCHTKFSIFTFFFHVSDSSGNDQLSFCGAGELCAELA